MTRRLSFLLGNLCGIAAGGLLVFVYLSNQPTSGTISPSIMPVSRIAIPVNNIGDPTPYGWERRDFNGHHFYIVPIAERNT